MRTTTRLHLPTHCYGRSRRGREELTVTIKMKERMAIKVHRIPSDHQRALSIIPARYEDVPVWRTYGRYRKQMKRGYDKELYSQRNKNETILSVIKRMFGEHITSRLVRMQNRELTFRVIAYNMHRLSVFMIWFLHSRRYLKIC